MKTLSDYNFSGKRVLLRIDINSPVSDGIVHDNPRIAEHARTIQELAGQNARVILLAHQGRPGDKDFCGLEQHAKLLEKHTGMKIIFEKDVTGEKAQEAIRKLRDGETLLLDNIRFSEEEFSETPEETDLVKTMSMLADVYVNDAFSASHRPHASVIGFRSMPSFAGRAMESELNALKSVCKPSKPLVMVLGGAKPEDSIKIMSGKKADLILTGGVIGQLLLIAKGIDMGETRPFLARSGFDRFLVEMKRLEVENKNIAAPLDAAYDENGRREISVLRLPVSKVLYDIGQQTIEEYKTAIRNAGTIILNGTMGMAENAKFRKGTEEIVKAVAESEAYSLVCGGHTTEFISKMGLEKKFSYVSLAGGAMLAALAGEKLPGVEALG